MRLPRVVIGMSGGVDSSVSAFLLKKKGFEVIGLHMRYILPLLLVVLMADRTIEHGFSDQQRLPRQANSTNTTNTNATRTPSATVPTIPPLRKVHNDLSHLTRVINAISIQNLAAGKIVKMREVGAELVGTRRAEFSTLLDLDVTAMKNIVDMVFATQNDTSPTISNVNEKKAALNFLTDSIDGLQNLTDAKNAPINNAFTHLETRKASNSWVFCTQSVTTTTILKFLEDPSTNPTMAIGTLRSDLHFLSTKISACLQDVPNHITQWTKDVNLIDQVQLVTIFLESYKTHLPILGKLPDMLSDLKNASASISNISRMITSSQATELESVIDIHESHPSTQTPLYTAGLPQGYFDLAEIFNDVKSEWFLKNVANGNKANVQMVETQLGSFQVFTEHVKKLDISWREFISQNSSNASSFSKHLKKLDGYNVDSVGGGSLGQYERTFRNCLAQGPNTSTFVTSEFSTLNQELSKFKNELNKLMDHVKTSNIDEQLLKTFFAGVKQYDTETDLNQYISNIKSLPNYPSFQTVGNFFTQEQQKLAALTNVVSQFNGKVSPDLRKMMNDSMVLDILRCFSTKNVDGKAVVDAIDILTATGGYKLSEDGKEEIFKFLNALVKTQTEGYAFETAANNGRTRRMASTPFSEFQNDVAVTQTLGSGLRTLDRMEKALAKDSLLRSLMNFNSSTKAKIVQLATASNPQKLTTDPNIALAFENPDKSFGKLSNELAQLSAFAAMSNGNLTSIGKVFEKASKIQGFSGDKEALKAIKTDMETNNYRAEAASIEELAELDLNFVKGELDSMPTTLAAAKSFFEGFFAGGQARSSSQLVGSAPGFIRESPSVSIGAILGMLFGYAIFTALLTAGVFAYTNREYYKAEYEAYKAEKKKEESELKLYEDQNMEEFEKRWRYSMFMDSKNGHNLVFEYSRMPLEDYTLLIEEGAYINPYNIYGSTPLHLATKAAIPEWVDLLIQNGANRTLLNSKNKTPQETIPKNYQELPNADKYKQIEEIYKKHSEINYALRLPQEFPVTKFKVFLEPRVSYVAAEHFKKMYPGMVSERVDWDTTHVVVQIDPTDVLNTDPNEADYNVLSYIFRGLIIIRESWLFDIMTDPANLHKSWDYRAERFMYDVYRFWDPVRTWTAARSKGSMPFLYGTHVVITATALKTPFLHEIVETLGGVIMPTCPDHYMYNETAHPILHNTLGPIFVIHSGEIDINRIKPLKVLSIFSVNEFIVFLLTQDIKRNEAKPVMPMMGSPEINWDAQEEGTSQCPRSKDESDARSICSKLKIPFYTANFVKEYWNDVFLKFLDNYRAGRTTVPDIDCNRSIKFDVFHKLAQEKFDADFIATGHYATTSFGDFQQNRRDSEEIRLFSGRDPLKDQTFFLCTVTQEQLRRSMFPLGSLMKTDVKRIAEQQGFHAVASKPESMGICFVGKKKRFAEFLDEYIEPKPGKIISSKNGKCIGRHQGIHHFTIGKRINGQYLEERSHLGYFVVDIDSGSGDVVACEGSHHPCLYATRFLIRTPNWIPLRNPLDSVAPSEILCRIQRTHPPVNCKVEESEIPGFLSITPRIPLRATAPGQMCVFYTTRSECLGGGEIMRIQNTL